MPELATCSLCSTVATPIAGRVCEHMLGAFMTPFYGPAGDDRTSIVCVSCDAAGTDGAEPVCDTCRARILEASVCCTADDSDRGYAIASRVTSHTAREIYRPHLIAVGVGDFVKLSFCQVPVADSRYIESMWITVTERDGDCLRGTLANEPGVFPPDVLAEGDLVQCHISQAIHTQLAPGSLSRLDVQHSCELCCESKRPGEIDEMDARLLADVRDHGWHALSVDDRADTPNDEKEPGFTYSIGLSHSFDCPELIITGLDQGTAQAAISKLVALARSGQPLQPDTDYHNVFEEHPVRLRTIEERESYEQYLGYAIWFYRAWFPAMQVVWPDSNGRFPSDGEFDPRLADEQPLLR